MHSYEYLFAAVVLVAMLLSSSIMIGAISEPWSSTSEREQLKVAAQKIITQILLTTGDPPEWGSNVSLTENQLNTFGLAKCSDSTREAYALDPSKVLRLTLNSTDPLYISPSRVKELLNLGYDYGLALEFYPALKVTLNDFNEVSVHSEQDNLPIFNAKVIAKIYYYNESSCQISCTEQTEGNTDFDGKCPLNFDTSSVPKDRLLILMIDYYGVRVNFAKPFGSNFERAYLLGNRVYGNEISENGVQIMINKKTGKYEIESVPYSTSKCLEPTTIAVLAVSNDGSKLIYAPRLPFPEALEGEKLTYSTIQNFNLSFAMAYSIERSVIICGAVYIVRLYLWRMSF
jgi:hypothetical protein